MKNNPRSANCAILLLAIVLLLVPTLNLAQNDTLYFDSSENERFIKWQHDYDKKLTMKLFMAQAEYDGALKRKDNGRIKVFVNFEEALEVIIKIDNLTLGIPKIIYLVGWQYNGHDSQYPAFFEGNKALKRDRDQDALESLRWLMKEAQKYHTTVSVHINMFDAYEDSPLWNIYLENDIIAKHKDGSPIEGEWGYPISYAQEWKTGWAQKRIDSLCTLLPLAEAGTVHIDAFHTWPPIGAEGPGKRPFIKQPTSPYLNFSVADETMAQKKIFKYWASKGIDVTSESSVFLREEPFAGYQPMTWWVDWGLNKYLKWPAGYYTGGRDRSDNGKLFGTSMHGEDIIRKDPKKLTGFKGQFCTSALVWYYLNQFERQKYIEDKNGKKVLFSEGVASAISDEGHTIERNGKLLVRDNDVFVPVPWTKDRHIVAYSKDGYEKREWQFPESWPTSSKADVFEITLNGKKKIGMFEIHENVIELNLSADQMILIKPHN